jgi:adenosylmethionine-8-amino-7-oxononanoate aminotransferase
LVCPPYTVTDGELEEIVSILKIAIDQTSQPFIGEVQREFLEGRL